MTYRSVFKPDLFKDKTAIITGGGSGIGRCTAHELASLGAMTILLGRTREKLDTTVTEILEDGGKAAAYPCDIRQESQVRDTVACIISDYGHIDGLVNNAGGQFASPLEGISLKGWDAVLRNNLTGGFLMSREVYSQSMKDNGGAIVNIVADMWGGMPTMGHSGAAREGMVNLTKTAAVEWACSGVRVNAVAPGWIASSGMNTYPEEMHDTLKNLKNGVPLKRMGNEAEVSAAITFLLSDAAAFITGDTLRIDGGASLGNTTMFPLPDHARSKPLKSFHREEIPEFLRESFPPEENE